MTRIERMETVVVRMRNGVRREGGGDGGLTDGEAGSGSPASVACIDGSDDGSGDGSGDGGGGGNAGGVGGGVS